MWIADVFRFIINVLLGVLYFFSTVVNQEDSRIYIIPFNSVDEGAGDRNK